MKKGDKDNGNLYGSFIDPCDETIDPFEHVSDEELSYIKETQSSIIAGRKWYSWHKDIGEYSPGHSSPQKNNSPIESKAVAATDNNECENSLNSQLSGDEDHLIDNIDEYYFDESEDDEQNISLLTANGADSTDPELLRLSIVDDDYADQVEPELEYHPESENPFLGDISNRSDIDWLDVDTDEFEDELSQYRDIEVTTGGKISRHDRAFQIALGIGEEFDLERDEIDFLADLFCDSGWSATKTSIIQALKNHSTIEELRLAYAVKLFWREHSEFTSSYSNQYNVLSWPTAIAIIRSFGSYPDIVEVESILFYIFECWEADLMLQRTFKEFGYYLYYRFGCIDRTLDIMPEWTFETDPLVNHDWLMPPSTLDIPNLTEFKSERQLCKIRLRYAES